RYSALVKFRPLSPEIRIEVANKMLYDPSKLVRIGVAQLLNDINDQSLTQIDQAGLNKAKEEYKTMLLSSADFSNGRMQLGDYYIQKNDYSKAIKHYNMALKKDSLLTPVYSNLATAYSLNKDYENAISTLDAWGKIDSKEGRVHYLKGRLFFEMAKNDEAVSELKTAI
ncbi:tetratricopeptide repeat protein, partial [Rhodobacteraceae bacterium B1Z28]|nr:tetratricopeptide repeat protein [Ruegeria haliotis]